MKEMPYTYSVLRYVHDPVAGESLNVGILLFAPDECRAACKIEYRYERLSQTFRHFNGEQFRRTLADFDRRLNSALKAWAAPCLMPVSLPTDAGAIVRSLWPDLDLCLVGSPSRAGVTHDIDEEADALFERFVSSRTPEHRRDTRRTDEDVWAAFLPTFQREHLSRVLEHKRFSTPDFEIEFPHAIKNHLWHPLHALSLDYSKTDSLQKKAATWLGNAVALQKHPDLGTLYLLLGKPRNQVQKPAYDRARALLDKMPIQHQLVEEDEAEQFTRDLVSEMRSHGVPIP